MWDEKVKYLGGRWRDRVWAELARRDGTDSLRRKCVPLRYLSVSRLESEAVSLADWKGAFQRCSR